MGRLWERLLGALGPKQITIEQKPILRGIDHLQETQSERRVINLKSSLSTPNGDINAKTIDHLLAAKDTLGRQKDDNPMGGLPREIVMVRAVARGEPHNELLDNGIRYLVGNAMWQYFGGGDNFLSKVTNAMERHTIPLDTLEDARKIAVNRIADYIDSTGLFISDGKLDWLALCQKYP